MSLERCYSLRAAAKLTGIAKDTLRRWLLLDLGLVLPDVPRGSKVMIRHSDLELRLERRGLEHELAAARKRSHQERNHMTQQEAKAIVGRLFCLGRSVQWFSLPIEIAARWVPVADLLSFTDEVEKHVRALAAFVEEYLGNHPGLLDRCDQDTRVIVESDLGDVRKQLALIPKIAQGRVVLDIDDSYLPQGIPPIDPILVPEGPVVDPAASDKPESGPHAKAPTKFRKPRSRKEPGAKKSRQRALTLDDAYTYGAVYSKDTSDLEKALRAAAFLLEWSTDHGNESPDSWLVSGIAKVIAKCAADVRHLFTSEDIEKLGADPRKIREEKRVHQ